MVPIPTEGTDNVPISVLSLTRPLGIIELSLGNDLASEIGITYPSVGTARSKSSLALENLFIVD